MKKKFLHIYINPKQGVTQNDIEEKMSLALDWYRYDDKIYLVYTSSDASKWQGRLIKFVQGGGRLFISPLDIDSKTGWMEKDFWEFIKSKKLNEL
ncbi:hypothetical protein AD998_15240 [bacterium 336/3]|nr:hypothetical protein AD998_15240 [bacterium 336/3]